METRAILQPPAPVLLWETTTVNGPEMGAEEWQERLEERCIREKKEDWEKKKDSGVTGGERLDKRWADCILMLPDCLYGRCQTERGIVWVKTP